MLPFLQIRKITVIFVHVLFGFVSLYLFVLTFAIKLKDACYKSYWNILVFLDQSKIMSDLNMFHEKMSDFVSFPLFGFTLVIKLRNFDFESHWNTLIIFVDQRENDARFEFALPNSVWFGLRFAVRYQFLSYVYFLVLL